MTPLLCLKRSVHQGGDGQCDFLHQQHLGESGRLLKTATRFVSFFRVFQGFVFERDISMHKGFRDELWGILDGK
ncbi:hypothetical protein SESBI_26359 [Sesbania bispinosa]|nr:hypothetical protein SESBI_26359 [Sesbania bispinosa]